VGSGLVVGPGVGEVPTGGGARALYPNVV
jgi:hypothetical protein